MVEVRKKENESPGSLLRRFSKRVQMSGFLLRARKNRSRVRAKSDYQKKKEALHKIKLQKEMAYMEKLGKARKKR